MHKIPPGTWIVVADGTHARFFLNEGTQNTLRLKQSDLMTASDEAQGQGPSGRRPPEASQEQTDEATFTKQLAHRLNTAALRQAFEHLFLIADPKTMGEIRPQLHGETGRRLIGELTKTFTNAPLEDIEKVLKARL